MLVIGLFFCGCGEEVVFLFCGGCFCVVVGLVCVDVCWIMEEELSVKVWGWYWIVFLRFCDVYI